MAICKIQEREEGKTSHKLHVLAINDDLCIRKAIFFR